MSYDEAALEGGHAWLRSKTATTDYLRNIRKKAREGGYYGFTPRMGALAPFIFNSDAWKTAKRKRTKRIPSYMIDKLSNRDIAKIIMFGSDIPAQIKAYRTKLFPNGIKLKRKKTRKSADKRAMEEAARMLEKEEAYDVSPLFKGSGYYY